MQTDNPFFKLYDKLSSLLAASSNKNLLSQNGFLASAIATVCGNSYGAEYSEMTKTIIERGTFYYGAKSANLIISEWAKDRSNEEILFTVERAGLIWAERRRKDGFMNPFRRTLEIIEDPRVALSYNSRAEFEFIIATPVCLDYGLPTPFTGDVKNAQLDLLLGDLIRKTEKQISRNACIDLMIDCYRAVFPDQALAVQHYWGVYNVIDALPFDFNDMIFYLETCAQKYDEIYTSQQQLALDNTKEDITAELAVLNSDECLEGHYVL